MVMEIMVKNQNQNVLKMNVVYVMVLALNQDSVIANKMWKIVLEIVEELQVTLNVVMNFV